MLKTARWVWVIGLLSIMTGCWDRVEIEDRGFIVGTAIDSAAGDSLLLTFQYGVPSALQQNSSSGGKSGNPYMNISMEAKTLFKAARKISNVVSRSPYLVHNRVIIVSDKLAKQGRVGEILDLFIRDPEMRRAAKVMIAEGEARALLEIKPKVEKLPVQYIDSATDNPNKSESILHPANMGMVHQYLLDEASFAIPKIKRKKQVIDIAGAAVFNGHDQKMRGYLSKDETTGRNFITGHVKTAAIEVLINNEYIVFELKSMNKKIKANMADPEHPIFDIQILIEGNVGEFYSKESLMEDKTIKEIEAKVNENIQGLAEATLEKLQRDYKTDILGLGTYLREEHYKKWKLIGKNWDTGENYFSQSQVRIHVKTKLRIVGMVLKSG